MKKIRRICLSVVATLVACLFVLSGCAKKGDNLFKNDNGAFKYEKLSELEKDWILEKSSDVSDKTKVFTLNADKENDKYSLKIDTSDSGWAYVGQKVKLTRGKYYIVTYSLNISSMSSKTSGEAFDGAYVAILEDDDFNYKTGVANVPVSEQPLMHKTCETREYKLGFQAKSGGEATIALKVGSEEHPASATVTLNKFTLQKSDKIAVMNVNNVGKFKSDHYGRLTDFNAFYVVLGGLATLFFCCWGYFLFQRHLHFAEAEDIKFDGCAFARKMSSSKAAPILVLLGGTLFVRLLVDILSTAISAGYAHSTMGYNLEGLTTQATFIAKYGPTELEKFMREFASDNSYTSMAHSAAPLQVLLLGLCGLFGRIFESSGHAYAATMFFVRLACVLADVGVVAMLYSMIKKSTDSPIAALTAASTYSLLPVVFAFSSLWGYFESITAFLVILVAYFILKNSYVGTALAYFAACMFSFSALFLAPFVIFYTIIQCAKDVRNILPASLILVLGFFAFYGLNAPFDYAMIKDGKPFYCFARAWDELFKSAVYVRNAFNFQSMLGNNFQPVTTASSIVTAIFIIFLLSLAGASYFQSKNRMNLLLLCTAFINMMYVFGNNMNPVSMYISLVLMYLFAVMNREKRIYFSFVVFAICAFVNASFCELLLGYTSTSVGNVGRHPLMYVVSSIELLIVLYYVYVVYDIVVSRKALKIMPMALTAREWWANVGRRIRLKYYNIRRKKG